MISLCKAWKVFFRLFFAPLPLILLAVAIFLGVILVYQVDTAAKGMLTIMVSTISGVLGSVVWNRWSSLNEEKIIVARGKVAVRSLKLLLGNISSIDDRVRQYLKRFCYDSKKKNISNELIKTYLEEIINRCGVLEEEALSSIENWTDIVPEADIKTQIGLITKLREEIAKHTKHLYLLRSELTNIKGKSEEKEKQLRDEIEEKESELSKLRIELGTKDYEMGYLVESSGSKYLFPSTAGKTYVPEESSWLKKARCRDCNKEFTTQPGWPFTPFPDIYCPNCGSHNLEYLE